MSGGLTTPMLGRFAHLTQEQIAAYGQIRGAYAALDEAVRVASLAGFAHAVLLPLEAARREAHEAMQGAERVQS